MNGVAITSGLTHLIYIENPAAIPVLTSVAPINVGGGGYHVDFTIPAAGDIGVYRMFWVVTFGGVIGIIKLPFWIDDP